MNNRESFELEARYQGQCAGCGSIDKLHWQAHHVVYRQECRRRRAAEWDPRDALRVCTFDIVGCHYRHHDGTQTTPLTTSKLLDCNIEFAFEILGVFAVDYLRRHYDDSSPDPRLLALEAAA